MIDDTQLIQQLLASDLISQRLLQRGLELAQRDETPLYEVLIAYDLVDEKDVVATASEILNVPSVRLSEIDIDGDTAGLIPAELAINNQSVPVEVIEDDGVKILKLAMTDPIDVMAMDEIASHIGIDIQPVLAGPGDVQAAIDALYAGGGDSSNDDDGGVDFDDFAMELESAEEDDEPLDLYGDDDIQLSGEFIIDDAEVAQTDDDVQLSGEFVIDDEQVDEVDPSVFDLGDDFSMDDVEDIEIDDALDLDDASSKADGDSGDSIGDVDSWAAMFDDDAGKEKEDVPYVLDEIDEDEEKTSPPPDDAQGGSKGTFLGTPADMSLGDLGIEEESDNEEQPDPSKTVQPSADDPPEEQEEEDRPRIPLRKSGGHGATPVGFGTRNELPKIEAAGGLDEETAVRDDADPIVEEQKSKSAVPQGLRDALSNASQKKKKKKKKKGQKKKGKPKSADASGSAALGRIDVKKVAVPAFKGAVEKRSDKEREGKTDEGEKKRPRQPTPQVNGKEEERPRQPTPQVSKTPPANTTREISLSDMGSLIGGSKSGQQDSIELPGDVDLHQFVSALVKLLIARDVLTAEEVENLIEELS